jgi:tRNA-splicing ligase RtcB
MGRLQAKGKYNRKTGEVIRPGLVSQSDMDAWVTKFDVELRGGGVDESPHVYRRIEQVLHAHRDTVKIVQKLKPIGVCMADERNFDPYKD